MFPKSPLSFYTLTSTMVLAFRRLSYRIDMNSETSKTPISPWFDLSIDLLKVTLDRPFEGSSPTLLWQQPTLSLRLVAKLSSVTILEVGLTSCVCLDHSLPPQSLAQRSPALAGNSRHSTQKLIVIMSLSIGKVGFHHSSLLPMPLPSASPTNWTEIGS